MRKKTVTSLSNIEKALSEWEEAVVHIEKGWDDIDEYSHDLFFRETLDNLIFEFGLNHELPEYINERLEKADEKFKSITEDSDLHIYDISPKITFAKNGIQVMNVVIRDKKKYWYYYRWQPDSPITFRGHNVFTYQRDFYGLDFITMSDEELYQAACQTIENAITDFYPEVTDVVRKRWGQTPE